MDAVRRAEERRKAERARAIAAGGDYPENITVEEAVEVINELAEKPLPYTYRARQEAEEAKEAEKTAQTKAEDAQYAEEQRLMGEMSQREVDAEIAERVRLADAVTNEGIASVDTGSDGGKDAPLSLREQQQRVLDQITSMAEIEPYQRDQDLTAMLKKQMTRDPSTEGRAAIERIKELSGLEEGRRMLEAQRSRLREDYEAATPSGLSLIHI